MGDWIVILPDAAPRREPAPINTPKLLALQTWVGGYVEVVVIDVPSLPGTLDLWVNEEGAYSGAPINHLATLLARAYAPATLLMSEGIRGGAVLTRHDDKGSTTPLTAHDIEVLMAAFEAVI